MSEIKTSHECVEIICQLGCTAVRDTIVKLEQQEKVGELEHLNEKQKHNVLKELKTIMSVYDKQED